MSRKKRGAEAKAPASGGTGFSLCPEAAESTAQTDDGANAVGAKKRRAQVRYKLRELPPPVRAALEHKMLRDYHGARDTSKWLLDTWGQDISPASIAAHKRNTDLTLGAVSVCTAQAQAIVEQAGGNEGKVNRALTCLVQTALFEVLTKLRLANMTLGEAMKSRERSRARRANRAEREGKSGKEERDRTTAEERSAMLKAEAQAMSILGRAIASLGSALRGIQPYDGRTSARAEGDAENAAGTLRDGGLSPEAEASIRAALMDSPVSQRVTKSAQPVKEGLLHD